MFNFISDLLNSIAASHHLWRGRVPTPRGLVSEWQQLELAEGLGQEVAAHQHRTRRVRFAEDLHKATFDGGGEKEDAMAEQGGYGELVTAPAINVFKLPDSLSFVDAASMSLVYDTAWFALFERGRLAAGETALILGASGGVGYASVQLAKAQGAKVLAGLTTPAKASLFDADEIDGVVDLSVENLRDGLRGQVHALTDGNGVDVVMDPLGDEIFGAALRALAWRGRLVVVGFAAGEIPTLKANYLLLKNIEVRQVNIG